MADVEKPLDDTRRMQTAKALTVALVAGAVVLVARHVANYFFLIDDYALIGEAGTTPPWRILTEPLFGFYRPATFLFVRAESALYGWQTPWAFAGVAGLLHAVNATLVALLTAQVTRDRPASWCAGGLFAVSPWSAEAFLWTSGRFDLLATCGTLSTMALSLWAAQHASRLKLCLPAIAALSVAAVASKEHAVVLPALLLTLGAALRLPLDTKRRLIVGAVASAVGVSVYIVLRQRVLPGLGGAYGAFGDLVASTDLLTGLAQHSASLLRWPLPQRDPWSGAATALIVAPVLGVALPALLWVARRQWATMTLFAVLTAVALAPVVWAPPSGRFLYLPGVWLAMGLSVMLAEWTRAGGEASLTSRVARWVTPFAFVLYALVSLHTQVGWWANASTIARNGITSFAPVVDGSAAAVHIPNLPFRCVEGPVILTSYAFQHYYRGRSVPSIRATAHMVHCEGENLELLPGFPDPLAVPSDAFPGETEVRLRLNPPTPQ